MAREGLRRRVLVVRTMGGGREILAQLARRGCSWAGFELATPLGLAERIVEGNGADAALERVDEFGEQRLIERALDDVLARDAGRRFSRLADLVGKVGFRNAVRHSAKAVRLAGLSGRDGARQAGGSDKVEFVAAVLGRFEDLLQEGGLSDQAWVLARAAEVLERQAQARPAVYLLPGHSGIGLEGRFLRALMTRGAHLLRAEEIVGLSPPRRRRELWAGAERPVGEGGQRRGLRLWANSSGRPSPSPGSWLYEVRERGGEGCSDIEVFRAASVYDELRGVLRRAVARGARWDEIEIVTPSPDVYGSALHAIAEPLGIPVTFAAGLPVQRTRPGRVVAAYFRWIEDQFAEPVIRALVEAGDLRAPGAGRDIWPRRLAEALRRLRIGYRRDRYAPVIARALADVDRMKPGRYESPERFEERKRQWTLERTALKNLLIPVIKATPPTDGSSVSPAQVAAGVQSLLKRTARGTEADKSAQKEIEHRLDRIRTELNRPTAFDSAVAVVRGFLNIAVAPADAEGQAPRTSAPGHVHLSSLDKGGLSGRPHTFLVGMDSGSFPGPAFEDPLLPDEDRKRMDRGDKRMDRGDRRTGHGEIGLAEDITPERRFLFAELFARLRGRISVSYSCWDPSQARELAPAAEILQVLRLKRGKPDLSFKDLNDCLGPPESRLPRGSEDAGGAMLDRDDVWMSAISDGGGRLRRASHVVGRAYSGLGNGMAAADALKKPAPSVHAGILGTAVRPFSFQDVFTRANGSPRPLSAGALGHLGACPRRFLFRTILGAYPPDDPEFDPNGWLNALQRGSILHRVYEQTLRTARDSDIDPEDCEFMDLALERVRWECERALVEIPCPSQAVQQWETEAMCADVRVFVEMIRDEPPDWRELEWPFGGKDGMEIELGGRSVLIRGAVDRVDDCGAGLRLVDYKTGKATKMWDRRSGLYDGGRRLQHVVYAAAANACLGRLVERMEYQFPTRRGKNEVRAYGAADLAQGGELIAAMLEGVEAGWFPATEDPRRDCRFCDYQDVCGVVGGSDCRHSKWTADCLKAGELAQNDEAVADTVPVADPGPVPGRGISALKKAREWRSEVSFP